MNVNVENLSNAEIRIELKKIEDEYTVTQNKIKELVNKLSNLDKDYIDLQNALNKRMKGFL